MLFVARGAPTIDVANYVKLAKTAKRLVEKNGRSITLLKRGQTPLDANKPWRANNQTGTATDILSATCLALFTSTEWADVPDTGTRRSVQNMLVSALSVVDDNGVPIDLTAVNQVTDGSDVWQIHDVKLVYPGTVKILWKFRLYR